jgi:lysophospholipase L1-like esterase
MQATNGSAVSFRSRGRLIGCFMALALALSALIFAPASANATTQHPAEPVTTYLALGDSLSFSYTEEKAIIHKPNEAPAYFEEGFTNYFVKKLHTVAEVGKSIRLVNDGCPAETSNGLIGENTGLGGQASTESYAEAEATGPPKGYQSESKDWHPCAYHFAKGLPLHNSLAGLSQLEDALSILTTNNPYTGKPNEVKAVTLQIGSNDELAGVTQCEDEVGAEYANTGSSEGYPGSGKHYTPSEAPIAVKECIVFDSITKTTPHIVANIKDILEKLDGTGAGEGKYTGPIVLVGFYNPDAFVLPGSNQLQAHLNEEVEKLVTSGQFTNVHWANPMPKFNAYLPPTTIVKEEKAIEKYTEMCNVNDPGGSSTPCNGDIHPSVAGYNLMGKEVNEAYLLPACTPSNIPPLYTASPQNNPVC